MGNQKNCCSFPYRGFPTTVTVLTLAAGTLASLYAICSCNFLSVTAPGLKQDQFFGLFRYFSPATGACAAYSNLTPPDLSQESLQKAFDLISQDPYSGSPPILAGVALVLGGASFLASLFLWCNAFRKCGKNFLGFCVLLAATMQGLVFLILRSQLCQGPTMDCQLAQGGHANIAACILWFLGGSFICCLQNRYDDGEKDEGATVQTTTVVTETRTDEDGSRVVKGVTTEDVEMGR